MNTKLLMTSSALILGLAGVFALFAPDVLLSTQGAAVTGTLSVMIQLMGALYFSFALMNWTAKDSLIGGIYARPVSLANFSHFFAGALLLLKQQLSNEMNPVSYTHLRAHETVLDIVCRLLLEKKKKSKKNINHVAINTLYPKTTHSSYNNINRP